LRAGKFQAESREGVGINTFGVIENSLGVFKITFGAFFIFADEAEAGYRVSVERRRPRKN
jgi:hypothetical protein